MLTQDDLQQIGQIFDKKMDEKLEPIHQDIKSVKKDIELLDKKIEAVDKKIEAVDMKVEAVLEYQKKAQSEIMEKLVESNELNGEQLKKLDKRVDRIEKHLDLSPLEN